MNRSALVLLLPVLLAGCDVHSNKAANGEEKVAIHADEKGQVAFKLPFVNGQVQIPQATMHGGNVDIDGVKLPPGSTMTGFAMEARDHGATVNMAFNAPAPPDQVRSYFVDQFHKRGLEAAIAGDAVAGKSKDGSAFRIEVAAAGSGSRGTIVIDSRD